MIETVESTHHTGLSQEASIAHQWFVGIDWGDQNHQVVVLDQQRRRVGERVVPHDGTSLAQLASWVREVSGGAPSRVAVAIEVPRGAIVETLLEQGFEVFAINPKQLDRFRDRHTVAGAKDDRRDALVLADALRTDPQSFRAVRLGAPDLLVLRELSRAEEGLLQEFRRIANRLRDQLHRFYPQMLQLCSAADESWLWDLLELAPTPRHASLLSEDQVRRLLKAHRLRRFKAQDVLACLQVPALHVAPGAAEAAQAHCGFLLPCLRVLAEQLRACEQHVNTLLSTLAEDNAASAPSDVAIVQSLPGVGRKITAWLFAEAAQSLAERDYPVLRTHGGIAPVTRQSGKRRQVVMRRGCNRRLRHALYHMARVAMQRDAHFASVYEALRAKGQRHGQALRNLADRLLRILMAMLRDRTRYDASRIHGGQKVLMER
jgi:transposase